MNFDREQFERRGFATAPAVIGDEQISELVNNLGVLQNRRSRAGLRHLLRNPAVEAVAKDRALMALAQAVLGDGAVPFKATLFDKSPKSNWLVAWHQDTALPIREKKDAFGWGRWSIKDGVTYAHAPATVLRRIVALRLHLEDSNAENGPLRVLPETHTLGVLTDDVVHDLAAKISPLICLVPRGGVLGMSPLLVHASSKAHSQERRRVLHIEYAASMVTDDGLELATA